MSVQLDEWPQFSDTSGTPLTGGSLYVGTVNLAPRTNLITIYSDPDLTVPIANPQPLDDYGKATTRIYIPGKYSYAVDNSAAVQQELVLEAGSEGDTGTTSLDSVLGTNTITASGEAETITSYSDLEVYTFKAANTNTSSVTLNLDAVGAKAIVKNFDQAISAGDFTQNQVIRVAYNSTSDNFAWVDASVKTKRITKGSDIASATSITIPDNDGNYRDMTGSTGPIATINGVAGTYNTFQTDSTPTFTNSASLIMTGGADYTAAAGDILEFYQLTASTVINTNITKADGSAVTVITPPLTLEFTSANQAITLGGLLTIAHGLSVVPSLIRIIIENQTTEGAWVANDQVEWITWVPISLGQMGPIVWMDSTNINVRYGTSTITLLNKTTGVAFAATPANWEFIFKVWA